MRTALGFLVAARRCEIHGLEQLQITSALVKGVSELVHMLQKERGTSNVFLASRGTHFVEQRAERVAASEAVEAAVREQFEQLDLDSGRMAGGVRLFTRIAQVLNALDGLEGLRARIAQRQITPELATRSYTELIAGLLAVVFEAADTAADPEVTRALVGLFNLMQGKELAGQERAAGAAGFASGGFDSAARQRLQQLIEAQERCLQTFAEFADPVLGTMWSNAQSGREAAEFERLRRLACSDPQPGNVADVSDRWFDSASARIDAMRQVEDCATNALLQLCEAKLAAARADLHDHKRILDSLLAPDAAAAPVEGGIAAAPIGPQLGRSVLDLMQEQSRRLQQISDELARARAALNERKLIERAKGLLMANRGLSEEEAYRFLRQTAMNQNRRITDVAEATLALADVLRLR